MPAHDGVGVREDIDAERRGQFGFAQIISEGDILSPGHGRRSGIGGALNGFGRHADRKGLVGKGICIRKRGLAGFQPTEKKRPLYVSADLSESIIRVDKCAPCGHVRNIETERMFAEMKRIFQKMSW